MTLSGVKLPPRILPSSVRPFFCCLSLSLSLSLPPSPRYFKQDSAIEIAARDTLVKGYIKLKLNTTDGVPLDDEEDPDAAAGEMTLDKVRRYPGADGVATLRVLRVFLVSLDGFLNGRPRIARKGGGRRGCATIQDESERSACRSCPLGLLRLTPREAVQARQKLQGGHANTSAEACLARSYPCFRKDPSAYHRACFLHALM